MNILEYCKYSLKLDLLPVTIWCNYVLIFFPSLGHVNIVKPHEGIIKLCSLSNSLLSRNNIIFWTIDIFPLLNGERSNRPLTSIQDTGIKTPETPHSHLSVISRAQKRM